MKVINLKHERFTHYIGRGSVFANPYIIGVHGTRNEVIKLFENYARQNTRLLFKIKILSKDAILGCFCKPLECHGDIIIKLWQELNKEELDNENDN